jgi:hypothetical protein
MKQFETVSCALLTHGTFDESFINADTFRSVLQPTALELRLPHRALLDAPQRSDLPPSQVPTRLQVTLPRSWRVSRQFGGGPWRDILSHLPGQDSLRCIQLCPVPGARALLASRPASSVRAFKAVEVFCCFHWRAIQV